MLQVSSRRLQATTAKFDFVVSSYISSIRDKQYNNL